MSNTPKYSVGDIVYLRESAALSRLEAVRINGIVLGPNNNWLYSIAVGIRQPSAPPVYGDRISLVTNKILYFSEDELVTVCDALVMSEANALLQFQSIRAQRVAICPNAIVPSTAGTDLDDINK